MPGLDLAGLNHPARTVSGDLYDVVVLGPERAAILCADVSGKGFASALMAAEIQAYVRATLRASCVFADPSRGPLPVRVASLVNAELCRHHQASGRYATMFLGEYDARDRSLNYVNAGQNPPLLMSPGGEPAVHLTTGGPPLGLFEDATWEAGTATVPKGGTVLVYTDGVIEARNPDGAEFGMERLIEICSTRCGCDALLGNVMNAVRVWCREGDQADDITLLAFAPAHRGSSTTTASPWPTPTHNVARP